MYLRTIQHLKEHLLTRKISPEDLGRSTRISNMTIRRMLEKPEVDLIPPKYHPALDLYINSIHQATPENDWIPPQALQDFEPILQELEKEGAKPSDVPSIKKQLQTKLTNVPTYQTIRDHTTTLLRFINRKRAPGRLRAVSIGALLYFINPADLISDFLPAVGYLDDFAVLSLVVKLVLSEAPEAGEEAPSESSNA